MHRESPGHSGFMYQAGPVNPRVFPQRYNLKDRRRIELREYGRSPLGEIPRWTVRGLSTTKKGTFNAPAVDEINSVRSFRAYFRLYSIRKAFPFSQLRRGRRSRLESFDVATRSSNITEVLGAFETFEVFRIFKIFVTSEPASAPREAISKPLGTSGSRVAGKFASESVEDDAATIA